MTTFRDLVKLVRDDKLEKDKLELYRDGIVKCVADMQMELGDLQKTEALFMGAKSDGQSVADRKIQFKVTDEGLRMIEVKNHLATGKVLLKGLMNRIYSKIF